VIPITPFTYTPANGNLLLDVVINSSGNNVGFVFGDSPDTSRVYNSAGSGAPTADPDRGLETQFTVQAVPEPSSIALLGLGTLGLLGYMCWPQKKVGPLRC
jgi:hypothetical protein